MEFELHFKNIKQSADLEPVEKIKMLSSRDIVKHLQFMFAKMLLSNVKYQDPTKVLENIVDDFGNPISIYEQQDIGEFFLNFLERLQDGLCENKNLVRKILGNDLAENMRKMSLEQNAGRPSMEIDQIVADEQDSVPQVSNTSINAKMMRNLEEPGKNEGQISGSRREAVGNPAIQSDYFGQMATDYYNRGEAVDQMG